MFCNPYFYFKERSTQKKDERNAGNGNSFSYLDIITAYLVLKNNKGI
jgi:hypothetical protein